MLVRYIFFDIKIENYTFFTRNIVQNYTFFTKYTSVFYTFFTKSSTKPFPQIVFEGIDSTIDVEVGVNPDRLL